MSKNIIIPLVLILGSNFAVHGLPIGIPPNAIIDSLNSTIMRRFSWGSTSSNKTANQCRLRPVDKGIHTTVKNALEFSKLIEYTMIVVGYDVNPLEINNTYNYKPEQWARVASSHGQTILNLAFNYGILSLMTLSFGITKLDVELEDEPVGCLGKLTENEKVLAVMDIVLRDLKPNGRIKVFEGQSSVCHQYIKEAGGMAKFTDRCCYESVDSETIKCIIDIPNKWLRVLDILLGTLSICVFIFGPAMIPDWFYTAAFDTLEYYVKLKEPLYKKMAVCSRPIAQDIKADHILDLRKQGDFKKCRTLLAELPDDMIIPIKISQFDIRVNYRKLVAENKVPVGMIDSLSRAIFLCKIRELNAFKDCCDANITGCACSNKPTGKIPWINFCNLFGRILLVFFVPFPFYIRLIVYYMFENPEIMSRHEAADNLDLVVYYNFRLIQFLTPTHPIYITIYVIYFLSGFTIAYLSGTENKTTFQQAIMDAFQDMKGLSMLNAFEMLISNCLWPFKKYGIFGFFIGLISWPLLLPISTILCCIYCLPMIFVSFRIVLHTFNNSKNERRDSLKPCPQEFHADKVIEKFNSKSTRQAARETIYYCTPNITRFVCNLFLSAMAIITLCAAMLIVAEIATFIAEIVCFTMMGVIVNASTVLKYGTLLFLVVLYSFDCYSNVNKKYLKLNKAIFSEIKYRLIKDIEQFTQLPSNIQENRGFKSAEASEQAEYESIDDISNITPFHWTINDLILFIDKEDTPRIPKKLFDDVCQINVAGAPGPVYRSLIDATRKFLIIICFLGFVFIVVLSFGESYKMSSANQMLATMAGGFAPLMFRYVFKPGKADVETGLLSFKSKLEEIIKNFCQDWPMYEFVFDIEEEPKSEDEKKEEENKDEEEDKSFDDECVCSCLNEVSMNKPYGIKDMDKVDSTLPADVCCIKHAKNNDSKRSSLKSKNGKDDKDGKKDKDKKGSIDWLALISRQKSFYMDTMKETIDNMVLEPAEGTKVDILIYVSDSDKEWKYEESLQDYEISGQGDEYSDSPLMQNNAVENKSHEITKINISHV